MSSMQEKSKLSTSFRAIVGTANTSTEAVSETIFAQLVAHSRGRERRQGEAHGAVRVRAEI